MSVSLNDGHIDDDVPELKPCPFCGGEAEIYIRAECENILRYPEGLSEAFGVRCIHCKAYTTHLPNEEIAIEAWNRRVDNGN